jgi:hypothetical protein
VCGAPALLGGLILASACGATPAVPASDSREVCLIRTENDSGLPRLYRRANAHTLNLGPARNLCSVPKEGRPLADRCEDVDDLSALLGTGKVCGPSGSGTQSVCPGYPADRLRREAAVQSAPTCAGGCENVQIAIHELSGSVTRVLFYDDPACHSAADPGCPGADHACYYRVLALTSELR